MRTVDIQYCVIYGKGDASDWCDYEVELTDEEAAIYDKAVENETPLEDVTELQEALNRVYEEIEEMEIQNGIDYEEDYVMECLGLSEMDRDELNDLIESRDSHALAFFGLEEASEEELEEWDAYDLDEVPTVAEFQEDFEPCSPYDEGWTLRVKFVDPNE